MSTTTIDAFINKVMMDQIIRIDDDWYEYDFEDKYDQSLQYLYNTDYCRTFRDHKPDFDDFMAIQQVCFEYLESCGSLTHDMIDEKEWHWWCNIYALSSQWRNCSMDDFKFKIWEYQFANHLEAFQANVRRRQAQIKVIKSLHLTGNVPTVKKERASHYKCEKCGTKLEEGEIYVRDNLDLCFDCKYVEVQQ